MKQWHDILHQVLQSGEQRADRTGVGTKSVFGASIVFDLGQGFPAVTTKKLAFKQMAAELSCFVRGYRTLDDFHKMGCTIWDANGTADYWKPEVPGDLGRIYGAVWRNMNGIDQLAELITNIKKDPWSRRLMVTAWSPGEPAALPPCHTHFQCSVREGNRLDLCVYMRSVDLFLGLPFDIASYALLTHLLAKDASLFPGKLTMFLADAHIYANHMDQVATVLSRAPLPLARLLIAKQATTLELEPSQVWLENYNCHSPVKAEMAV